MKYHHFDITPFKITEILWNPEEIRWKFDKDLQNLLSILKFCENCVKFWEKWCKGPEKSEKSGMVQRKKGELEKRWKMRLWTQKSALIQPKTSLGKGLKNVYSEGPRWLYKIFAHSNYYHRILAKFEQPFFFDRIWNSIFQTLRTASSLLLTTLKVPFM